MRMYIALFLFSGVFSAVQAEINSPWFGSAASAPEQVNFVRNAEQLVDSDEVSEARTFAICTIEGCPLGAKLVKLTK